MREDIGIRNYMRLGGDTSKLGIEGMAFGMDETGKISKWYFPTTLAGLQNEDMK